LVNHPGDFSPAAMIEKDLFSKTSQFLLFKSRDPQKIGDLCKENTGLIIICLMKEMDQ
jgi:hypothetical protein